MKSCNGVMKTILLVTMLLLIAASSVYAGESATQRVSFKVTPLNDLTLSGETRFLEMKRTPVSNDSVLLRDSSLRYSVSSNQRDRKITGMLNENTPADTKIRIHMAPPRGAADGGNVVLSTLPHDLIKLRGEINEKELPITYMFSAEKEGELSPCLTRKILLTITGQ